MIKFRDLRSDEIDVRVSSVSSKGITLLLYKDARCDMRILDETVGPENWQREHYECKGNLFCRVGIRVKDNDWVWKSDCGTESRTEAQKGEASDSFKRACFNWGIGRELYTAPLIYVRQNDRNGDPNYILDGNKIKTRFFATYMRVENGKIVALNIEATKPRKSVFTFGNCFPEGSAPTAPAPVKPESQLKKPQKATAEQIEQLLKAIHDAGVTTSQTMTRLRKLYPDSAPDALGDISYVQWSEIMSILTNHIREQKNKVEKHGN